MIEFKQHQKKIVNYFKEKEPRGVILYHGLGSGKTITSIGIAELYNKNVVCIVPASMRTQWKNELNKMNVKNTYKIYSFEEVSNKLTSNIASIKGTKKKKVSKKSIQKRKEMLDNKVVIIDEAHRLRNIGVISRHIINITKNVHKILLLTGTPIVNSPIDLSNLINIITKEKTLPTIEKFFNEKYLSLDKKIPPLKHRCKHYSPITCTNNGYAQHFLRVKINKFCSYHYYLYAKRINRIRKKPAYEKKQKQRIEENRIFHSNNFNKKINKKTFKDTIECLISYYEPNRKDDYPNTKQHYNYVKMSKEQNIAYKVAIKMLKPQELKKIEGGNDFVISDMTTFNAFLNKTRQISNTLNGNPFSPKLSELLDYCIKGPYPIIIYSNWIDNGIIPMSKLLAKNNITHEMYTGTLNDINKRKIVNKYNLGKLQVLLISSSGAEGLDLKKTRQIHIMEPHWNTEKINQVIARGVRYKSHSDLPKSDRLVDIYYWISEPDLKGDKKGADNYLYMYSKSKKKYNNKFLDIVKNSSIEENKNCKRKKTIKTRILHKNNSS